MATVMEVFLRESAAKKFQEALHLQNVKSQSDPEQDPYKSKYAAREILHNLKNQIENETGGGDTDDDDRLKWKILTAVLDLKLGVNYANCEEQSSGEEHFSKCIDALLEHRLKPDCCSVLLCALNEMSILWAGRRNHEKALGYLEKADALYVEYKKDVGDSPSLPDEHFQVPEQDQDDGEMVQKRRDDFEDKHTHTLYYLAQVYGNLEESEKSAQYCHETLLRQLDTKKYDPIDWSLNAATLSQFYITRDNFPQGRHCLASATYILKELGDQPANMTVTPLENESQEELSKREKLPKTWADLWRCWIKYGLSLLEKSQSKLYDKLEKEYNESLEEHNYDKKKEIPDPEDEKKTDILKFSLELTAIESQIADEYVFSFESAREVFLVVQKWIKASKEFYVLDGYCTDHVELVQDHSKLFKLLAGFESDFERQCKMHKRRIDLLHDLLKELSMQHYLLICRQIIYELAETYSNILDVKLAMVEESQTPPNTHAKNKINQLANQSLEQYTAYLDSLKDSNKQIPSKYAEDDERPALVAYFCMGRLHSKRIESDVTILLANIKKSLDCYTYLVDYCKRNPECSPKVQQEKEICEEMIILLPSKMDRIRAQSQCQY